MSTASLARILDAAAACLYHFMRTVPFALFMSATFLHMSLHPRSGHSLRQADRRLSEQGVRMRSAVFERQGPV